MRIDPLLLRKIASNDATVTELRLIGTYDYYLSLDKLSLEQAQDVVASCQHNTHLTTLTISNCLLTHDVFALISNLLKTHKTITSICFNGNDLDQLAFTDLAAALAINASICSLDLRNNPICDNKAEVVLNLLKTNRSLVKLKMDNEFYYPSIGLGGSPRFAISPAMLEKINQLLQYNCSLKQTAPVKNSFFSFNNPAPVTQNIGTRISELIIQLDTECNLICFDTNKYMQLLALRYLNYLYTHKQHLDEHDKHDVLQKFPGLLADKRQEVYQLLNSLGGAVNASLTLR